MRQVRREMPEEDYLLTVLRDLYTVCAHTAGIVNSEP